MAKQARVAITNGDVTTEVLASTVKAWLNHGWTVVDDESDEAESESADEADLSSGPAEPDYFDEE